MDSSGTLYIVATPIGNLEDITGRALRILREADVIACEDTRHSRRLLDHYGIDRPLISYHDHNESPRSSELIGRLRAGENVALVSDAGTPLISDPGYRLVSDAAAWGCRVVPVPGPSAVLAALTASGLPTDSFYFGGFLPPKQGQRVRKFEALRDLDTVLVFYEAPHRILATMADAVEVFGNRPCVLTRELTKLHEEFLRGSSVEILRELDGRESVKGEITLLFGRPAAQSEVSDVPIAAAIEALISAGTPRMDAVKQVARERGLSKREAYAAFEKAQNT